ncbi:MAG TPA: hypothetical protein VMT52_12880 [Planctomycetota bacterium]|nr:hypothetical protein [Planctomycetota bacterium]
MDPAEADVTSVPASPATRAYHMAYKVVAYAGLMAILGALLHGFPHASGEPWSNFSYNLVLYAIFIAAHLVMTRPWFKSAFWGDPAGSSSERRVFVLVSAVTWFAVILLAKPLPGDDLFNSSFLGFAGCLGFLASFLLFFQGVTIAMLDGLLGVPGARGAFTHGERTPLFVDGPYKDVRHPQYRGIVLAGISSLLIHPNAAQFFWVLLIAGSFVAFIPVEEAQLIAARGESYRKYQEQTPHRIFKGIW